MDQLTTAGSDGDADLFHLGGALAFPLVGMAWHGTTGRHEASFGSADFLARYGNGQDRFPLWGFFFRLERICMGAYYGVVYMTDHGTGAPLLLFQLSSSNSGIFFGMSMRNDTIPGAEMFFFSFSFFPVSIVLQLR